MILLLALLQQLHGPVGQYAGGAPSAPAGLTALAVEVGGTLRLSAPAIAREQQLDTTFRHSKHTNVACTECHGTTATHGGLKFSRPAGCLACHHSPTQPISCTTCHATNTLGTFARQMTFAISARREAPARTISFAHARHAGLACTSCHAMNDVHRAVTTTCATCHANHHTPTATCTTCHTTARQGHDRSVHEGCARCHTDAAVEALPTNRQMCLVCHQPQQNHYPNRDCATCHGLSHDLMRAGRTGGSR